MCEIPLHTSGYIVITEPFNITQIKHPVETPRQWRQLFVCLKFRAQFNRVNDWNCVHKFSAIKTFKRTKTLKRIRSIKRVLWDQFHFIARNASLLSTNYRVRRGVQVRVRKRVCRYIINIIGLSTRSTRSFILKFYVRWAV